MRPTFALRLKLCFSVGFFVFAGLLYFSLVFSSGLSRLILPIYFVVTLSIGRIYRVLPLSVLHFASLVKCLVLLVVCVSVL